jgi:hypothetical protein
MTRVSVVGTYHVESGHTNAAALLALLCRIKPEVIFLEMPAAALADHFNGARSNLESIAVSRYRGAHHVELVPVDLATPDAVFFRTHEDMGDRIYRSNPDTRRLIDWNSQYIRSYGFAYLNSEHCSRIYSELIAADLAALAALAEPKLTEFYELWRRTLQDRERAMVRNIEIYCSENEFSRGALLVGAAHRQPLMDLVRSQVDGDRCAIEWDFGGFLETPRD